MFNPVLVFRNHYAARKLAKEQENERVRQFYISKIGAALKALREIRDDMERKIKEDGE